MESGEKRLTRRWRATAPIATGEKGSLGPVGGGYVPGSRADEPTSVIRLEGILMVF